MSKICFVHVRVVDKSFKKWIFFAKTGTMDQ